MSKTPTDAGVVVLSPAYRPDATRVFAYKRALTFFCEMEMREYLYARKGNHVHAVKAIIAALNAGAWVRSWCADIGAPILDQMTKWPAKDPFSTPKGRGLLLQALYDEQAWEVMHYSAKVQPDGRIICAGTTYSLGTYYKRLDRAKTDLGLKAQAGRGLGHFKEAPS
jgi:hypothetical protein